jgi:hypothetical protein
MKSRRLSSGPATLLESSVTLGSELPCTTMPFVTPSEAGALAASRDRARRGRHQRFVEPPARMSSFRSAAH